MSLSVAYNIARGALSAGSVAASVVARNVAAADDPNAAAKSPVVATDAGGLLYVTAIQSQVSTALLEKSIGAEAARSESAALSAALDELHQIFAEPQDERSPSALIGAFRNKLQLAAAAPHDQMAAAAAIEAARDVSNALNQGAAIVSEVRERANAELQTGVDRLNALLREFEVVNGAITTGTARRADVTDHLDRRNGLLRDLAELVDIRSAVRSENDMVLYLANGAPLFEKVPREVMLEAPHSPGPGLTGPSLRIDGWPMGAAAGVGGKIGGLLAVRDQLGITVGRQLDEIARGLIVATAEDDESPVPSAAPLAGLFTYAGGPGLPPSGVVSNGIASTIRINANVDPTQGGAITRLRDGGISDPGNPAFVYNQSGSAGYSARLLGLLQSIETPQLFDAAAGLPATSSAVMDFATDSAAWLHGQRATTNSRLDDQIVLAERSVAAWQNAIGINIDQEMTSLIALERANQATSRLLSSVDSMFQALLRATE